jgi:hypothetical protein
MRERLNPHLPNTPHGAALEAALEAIAQAAGRSAGAEVLAAQAWGLMIGYHARWAGSGWKAVAVEAAFQLPIVNPATGRRSRTFTQAGRCEGVVSRGGDEFLLESKTAGEDIDRPDAPFWRPLAVDTRTGTYALARRQLGRPVAGVLYDVLRRPHVRPRVIPKGTPKRTERENVGTRFELQRRNTYFGWPVDQREQEAVLQGDGRETAGLYGIRIASDTLRRPDWCFQRRVLRGNAKQLARCARELWETAVEIRLAWRAGRHYANSQACMAYHTPCPYLPICSGRDTPHSDRWHTAQSIHPELAGQLGDVDEREVLTPSRIQCFNLCRRRHYFRYQLGIVPVGQPASEALRLGRLIRQALAAWWANRDRS